ncbi:MAG TPA: hypothetical protein VIW95_04400 [Candidatus Binatus sp.]|uniref:hypothetical protein n=1 Tax=Candidatus Binatus sp. TaxID=2811406 RepID=UPI002F3ED1C7
MPAGKKIGEFSFKFTTFINTPGPAGGVFRQVTWEGPATGFGAVFTTVTFDGSSKGGTYSECGTAFMDNGDFMHGIGQGTYESTAKHRWRTLGFMQLSDGRRMSSEGEIDLAERSWKGKLFEMS